MLVLSRRPNETVVFPGLDVAVRVLSVKGDVVRLGIEAPSQITILRGELKVLPGRGVTPSAPDDLPSKHAGPVASNGKAVSFDRTPVNAVSPSARLQLMAGLPAVALDGAAES
jgi:carbon storage regulator CsrA